MFHNGNIVRAVAASDSTTSDARNTLSEVPDRRGVNCPLKVQSHGLEKNQDDADEKVSQLQLLGDLGVSLVNELPCEQRKQESEQSPEAPGRSREAPCRQEDRRQHDTEENLQKRLVDFRSRLFREDIEAEPGDGRLRTHKHVEGEKESDEGKREVHLQVPPDVDHPHDGSDRQEGEHTDASNRSNDPGTVGEVVGDMAKFHL